MDDNHTRSMVTLLGIMTGVIFACIAVTGAQALFIAYPQAITPAVLGGALGFFVSIPVCVKTNAVESIFDFVIRLTGPPAVGLILGTVIGLGL